MAPRSLEAAAALLRGGGVTVVAGGTDVMPQSRSGKIRLAPVLMSVRRVPELKGISGSDGTVRIGALVTISELLESALVRAELAVLWQACDHFASDQIRNAATIGGNVCNASPAGDTLVPLLALEARVVLAGARDGGLDTRRVPIAGFFSGPGRTVRAPHELVTALEIPLPGPGFVSAFCKFGTRPALDIPAVSIGFAAVREEGVLRNVRIALGAVAPTPLRAVGAEGILEGKPPDPDTVEAAVRVVQEEIRPISDVRASDWYRRELVGNLLRRMLAHVREG